MHRRFTALAIAASLFGGVAGGIAVGNTGTATAATPSSSPAASPAATAGATATTAPGNPWPGDHRGGGRGFGGWGGRHETVSDASVAAGAIGISETDVTTALAGGKSLADVARANNVDVQKVIDALVADAETELADQVKSGSLTQAQADQQKAGITQRVTNQVNSAGGRGCIGGPGDGNGSTPTSPSSSPATNG